MIKENFLKQIDLVLADFEALKSRAQFDDFSGSKETIDVAGLLARSKALIIRIAGENSEYYKSVNKIYEDKHYISYDGLRLVNIVGIVKGIRVDLENDFIVTLKELAHSEIFVDYIEMSEYLLKEGYKDSAAVIVGSTLESHLRELCKKSRIDIEILKKNGKTSYKKADSLNSDLHKANIYSLTYQKQITAWLDLRNNAAHGKYDMYNSEEVKLMLAGIRTFMTNYIA